MLTIDEGMLRVLGSVSLFTGLDRVHLIWLLSAAERVNCKQDDLFFDEGDAGDKFFAPQRNCVYFTGTLCEWETWLRFELAQNAPDAIVLFGSNRPVHKVARRLADLCGIELLCLEEGYLRG